MNNKTIKLLNNKLLKLYYGDSQRLYAFTDIIFNGATDFYCEIYATKKGTDLYSNSVYLFDIQTLNYFEDNMELRMDGQMGRDTMYNRSNLNQAAHTPFYINRVFTLKKFGCITTDDIVKCTHYFLRKVLSNYSIVNIVSNVGR